ncbi:unnamed protein product [Didymodactylos carnosus]|uniref:PARP catalytic domain-containing protein n=1 Tax=Didymodactylos carnosus TaxID=1234261 RepID=A0A814M212_9BILA|nr:unnamed protein product [Didymodactylos carnosus]CAF1214125.1 unnamed protein product [Didymodactylos carnosus]CAF3840667.1 unnamed protein product [Didymodactylos carnosus]CAF4022818.1 unnamed protein product [Didymodactylos carnosus]
MAYDNENKSNYVENNYVHDCISYPDDAFVSECHDDSTDHDFYDDIYLFESRQSIKYKPKNKQKFQSSTAIRSAISSITSLRSRCQSYEKTPKATPKKYRYNRQWRSAKMFQCDVEFEKSEEKQTQFPANKVLSAELPTIPMTKCQTALLQRKHKKTIKQKKAEPEPKKQCEIIESAQQPKLLSKELKPEHLTDFALFRRHFYTVNSQSIKSAFNARTDIEITDIRLTSLAKCVETQFMHKLKNDYQFPKLVFHGTNVINLQSILDYGLLIPHRQHPTNKAAPVIGMTNGKAHGNGIYCSQKADYSLSYARLTNTMLICAAIPYIDKHGKVRQQYGDIIVLHEESQIVPLFLLDFTYLNSLSNMRNYSFFKSEEKKEKPIKTKEERVKHVTRKFLRKMLKFINDDNVKRHRFQLRCFQ